MFTHIHMYISTEMREHSWHAESSFMPLAGQYPPSLVTSSLIYSTMDYFVKLKFIGGC